LNVDLGRALLIIQIGLAFKTIGGLAPSKFPASVGANDKKISICSSLGGCPWAKN
jgi:hypothetical protein